MLAQLWRERESLLRAFSRMDINEDGLLTQRELQRGLRDHDIRLSGAEMQQLMRVLDTDGDSTLAYAEFLDALEGDDLDVGAGRPRPRLSRSPRRSPRGSRGSRSRSRSPYGSRSGSWYGRTSAIV